MHPIVEFIFKAINLILISALRHQAGLSQAVISRSGLLCNQDQQHRLLQAVLKQVQGFQRSRTGKPNFAEVKSEVTKLQSVVAHYLAGSKV